MTHVFAALLLAASPTASQGAAEFSMGWLVGDWRGTGKSMGSDGSARLSIAPALDGKFLELRYHVATSGPRAFKFEGRAFYREKSGKWIGQWFDSRGTTFAIEASLLGTTFTSAWSGTSERGQTVYRLRDDGKLEVRDDVFGPDGKQSEFARFIYDRVGSR